MKCYSEIFYRASMYTKSMNTYAGDYWTIPGGGVHRGETVENAVIREVKEEVGIAISTLSSLGSYTSEAEYKKDTIHLFVAKVWQADIVKNSREISEARWFGKKMLPQNISKSLSEILLRL